MVRKFLNKVFGKPKDTSAPSKLEEKNSGTQDYGPREIVVHYDPVGSSGTEIYSGYIQEDIIDKMRGTERADIFDQMRRSDPDVKMCLSAVKNSIMNGTWEIEPGDDSAEAKKDADFIRHILFSDLNKPFLDILEEGMTVCEFGHSIFEITHKVVLESEFGSYIGLNLNWRSPRTIERWNVDKKTEKLLSISQYAYGDLDRLVDIPGEFLLAMNIQKEGANYEGISLLRPCYGPWLRRNNYLKINASGIEKFAVPTPIATVPDNKQGSEQFRRLELILQSYTYHQKNYIMKPNGWDLTFNSNTYDPSKVEISIDNEGQRMTRAFLANFLTLGMNTVGSYALSNDLSDFFLGGIEHIAGKFTSKFNMVLIPHLILINRGPRKVYPKLKCSGISDKAGLEFAQIITALTGQKVIIADDKLEDHMRKRLKLPERSLDGQRVSGPPPQFEAEKNDESLAEKIRKAKRGRLWARK